MTTRAEEIAAEGPYRADWENGFSVVRDLNAPEGNKIMMMMPDNMEWFADRMNEARANGYKQGQQDRWISVEERKPDHDGDVLVSTIYKYRGTGVYSEGYWYLNIEPGYDQPEGVVTHWMPIPSPPNPEQR